MRFLLTLVAVLLLSSHAFAQAPILFNYQGVLRDPNGGALITNRTVTMQVSILQGSATGNAVYVERHTPTTNINGLVTVDIGGGVVQSGALGNLAWSQGNYFLKVETDPIGNVQTPSYTISATSKLLSVPFAMYANQAGHYIGELFGGGIIFSLWRDYLGVEHGLIASLDDLGTRVWANPIITSNSVGVSADNGALNTAAIVAALGPNATNTAAGVCDAYANGAFTDWYLPAAMELNLLYTQAATINAVLNNDTDPLTNGLGSAATAYGYWSSSLAPDYTSDPNPVTGIQEPQAIYQGFRVEGGFGGVDQIKQNPSANQGRPSVRAIRRF